MKIEFLDEITVRETEKEKEKYGLEFIPNQETLDAMQEAEDMLSGNRPKGKIYHSAEEIWSDICGT